MSKVKKKQQKAFSVFDMPNECYYNKKDQVLPKNYYKLIHGKSSDKYIYITEIFILYL